MTRGYQPNWDIDLPYGEAGQELVERVLRWAFDGSVRIEVKRKRRIDAHMYFEMEQNSRRAGIWHPSGLTSTHSDVWACVVGDTGIFIAVPTGLLTSAVLARGRPARETDGDNPTEGLLLSFSDLLYHARTKGVGA